MTTINPDVLARLQTATLDRGSHRNPDEGACAMEWVSMLADEGFTDAPGCASRALRRYTMDINDAWGYEKRQQLKPYLVRMIGTAGDGKEGERREILRREVASLASPWLHLAGLPEAADRLIAAKTDAELRAALYHAESEVRKVTIGVAAVAKAAVAASDASVAALGATSVVIDAATLTSAAVAVATATAAGAVAGTAARDHVEMLHQIETSEAFTDFRKIRDEQDGSVLLILDKLIEAKDQGEPQ